MRLILKINQSSVKVWASTVHLDRLNNVYYKEHLQSMTCANH